MAFAKVVTDRDFKGGYLEEYGTWTLSGGDTSGTLTPDSNTLGINASMTKIVDYSLGSNGNAAACIGNISSDGKTLTVTSSANDSGEYYIKGRCA